MVLAAANSGIRLDLGWVDYLMIIVYFAVVIGIGFTARRQVRTSMDFFLSGRSMPAWITGLAFVSANLGATEILGMAVKRIRGKLDYTPIGFQLLPETFTLRRLQDVHETILGRTLNKDSFRRRMLASGLLEATGERETEVGHRPAEHYRFTRRSAI